MTTFNVGYELYGEKEGTRGVYLVEAATPEKAMDHVEKLLGGKATEDFGFLDVYETVRRDGDIPVIQAE